VERREQRFCIPVRTAEIVAKMIQEQTESNRTVEGQTGKAGKKRGSDK
jgi:hypothetical protein